MNSHGAVVAREHGIPAVVGVAGITRTVTSGRLLTVGGANGPVGIAPASAPAAASAGERD